MHDLNDFILLCGIYSSGVKMTLKVKKAAMETTKEMATKTFFVVPSNEGTSF